MYVYLMPQGGFNDIMCVIYRTLNYCNKYKRILLLDTTKSAYKINFSDYFKFNKNIKNNIIFDINIIRKICKEYNENIYPIYFSGKMIDIIDNKYNFSYDKETHMIICENILFRLPTDNIDNKIIIHSACGGGDGYVLFKHLLPKNNIKKHCKTKYSILKQKNIKYLSIQVRNTDRKCNYKKLYYNNKKKIHSYNCIYISTDDKDVIKFFKSKKLNIYNFTRFPELEYRNLHRSSINPDTKIKDLFCDLYMIIMSDKLLSDSVGGFIRLVKNCCKNKKYIIKNF
jgi:hypothetical protein